MKSQEVNFQKSQKLLASQAGSSKQTIACTAFTQPAIEIEWIAIECYEIGRLRGARSVSSFCDLTTFFSFLMRENLVFFRYS